MSNLRSKAYWVDHKDSYPYQTTVKHMSTEDIDPRLMKDITDGHFLRVPFDGQSHWGFKSLADLEAFNKRGDINRTKKAAAHG